MRTVETKLYTFDELSDDAKERAREWWRELGMDYDWYEFVFDDAAQCGACLGIDIDRPDKKCMDGEMRPGAPTIYFSGFYSHGDGACFEGSYSYRKGWKRALMAYAPQDAELLAIGESLQEVQRRHGWGITAMTKHSGHYNHSGCMAVTCSDLDDEAESIVTQCMRDFADWIYAQLERECEYQMSDEVVDETIRINEYEFEEDGTRA